eukprot:472398_1
MSHRVFLDVVCVIGVLLEIIGFIIVFKCTKKLLFSANKHRIKDKYIFVQTINKGQKKQKIKKKNVNISFDPSIRFGTILGLICYFIASCGGLSIMFIIANTHTLAQLNRSTLFRTIISINGFMSHLGRILVNFVFAKRLQSSFQDTPWMYSKRVFHCLWFMLFLLLFWSIVEGVIRAVSHILTHNTETMTRICIASYYCFIVIDLIFFVALALLFQKKVFELIKSYYVSYMNSIQNEQTMKPIELNDISLGEAITAETSLSLPTKPDDKSVEIMPSNTNKSNDKSLRFYRHISDSARASDNDLCEDIYMNRQYRVDDHDERRKHYKYGHIERELINSVVQQGILVSVSVTTSMVLVIGSVTWISRHDPVSPSLTTAFYGNGSALIECFINILCLYLQFPFALKLYRLLCCTHKLCLGCVAKCVEKANTSKTNM